MNKKTLIFSLFLLLILSMLVACGNENDDIGTVGEEDNSIYVVATTGQVGDAVKSIAGNLVRLDTLLGPGLDPHTYDLKASDLKKINDADIIFYNGLDLEAQMANALESLADEKTVIALGGNLPTDQLIGWGDESKLYDPHIWNDPMLWKQVVQNVSDTLIEADPDNAETYKISTGRFLEAIDELDVFIRAEIDRIPLEKQVVITAHDAFNYFGRAYNIEVRGLQGISTATEASLADIDELVDEIVLRQIPAVFVETSVSDDSIEAVIEAVQARGLKVTHGGALYSDSLGLSSTGAHTYLGMMRHNATAIANSLTFDVAYYDELPRD